VAEGAYLSLGSLWLALTLEARTRTEPLPEYSHIALSVSADEFNRARDRVWTSGAKQWQDNRSEGDSLYFSTLTDTNLRFMRAIFERASPA
jgi:glutathione S-transferase fosA5